MNKLEYDEGIHFTRKGIISSETAGKDGTMDSRSEPVMGKFNFFVEH